MTYECANCFGETAQRCQGARISMARAMANLNASGKSPEDIEQARHHAITQISSHIVAVGCDFKRTEIENQLSELDEND